MLATAADSAMLDLVMKVGVLFSCTLPSLMTASEHVPGIGALLEIHELAQIALDQSHEKFRL